MSGYNLFVLVLAVLVYIITIPIAWMLLARLMALTVGRSAQSRPLRFWSLFVLYQLVIVVPYSLLLLLGNGLPSLITNLLIGLIVATFLLSGLRFVGTNRTIGALWWMYGWVYDGLNYFYPYRHLKSQVVERVEVNPTSKILDLGCGTGNVMVDLLGANPKLDITGVDNSRTMLSKAHKNLSRLGVPSEAIIEEDALSYLSKVADDTFDQIVMLNVVYAVSDRAELWKSCLRVLKPGGKIVVTTSDRGGSKAIVREHLEHQSRLSLLHPSLLAVGVIDYFISEIAKTSVFKYLSADELTAEVTAAGGRISEMVRCYGGDTEGVNLLFDVYHA